MSPEGAEDNPGGHWESRSLCDFNDALLGHLGGCWSAPPEPMAPRRLTELLSGFRLEARERFFRVHPEAGWVWKDPRLCLVLPFWLDALDADPVLVLTVRPPRDVAASLERRNGLGPAHALALYERYASAALVHAAGRRAVVVRYDDLVHDARRETRRLRDALVHHGAHVIEGDAELERAIAAVEPTLRHRSGRTPRSKTGSESSAGRTSRDRLFRLLSELGASYETFPSLEPVPMDAEGRELLDVHKRLSSVCTTARQRAAQVHQLQSALHERRAFVTPNHRLPTVVCSSRSEYHEVQGSELFADRYKLEVFLAHRHQQDEKFTSPGFCLLCRRPVDFEVDWQYCHPAIDAGWLIGAPFQLRIPNWRERMLCPLCHLNNRQRAIASEIQHVARLQAETLGRRPRIYFSEQITPMFHYFVQNVPEVECVGSEYLGQDLEPGTERDGLRHENVEALGFGDGTFDFAVSCSVLEHVNEPSLALREMSRILRSGGQFFLEVPFDTGKDRNVRRARRQGSEVRHILPPEYHGNPLSDSGSLVYFDYGWQLFDELKEMERFEWTLQLYWSLELGHLGGASQFFFHGRRTG